MCSCTPLALAMFTRGVYPNRSDGYLVTQVSIRASDMEASTAPTPAAVRTDEAPRRPPRRIVIQYATPSVDGGRYPGKRCVGDGVAVSVDVSRDGHELIRAAVRYRGPDEEEWREVALERVDAHLGGVRWAGRF